MTIHTLKKKVSIVVSSVPLFFKLFVFTIIISAQSSLADSSSSSVPSLLSDKQQSLKICSLNMNNFGAKPVARDNTKITKAKNTKKENQNTSKKKELFSEKQAVQLKALVERVKNVDCDIVALQEGYGKTTNVVKNNIAKFVTALTSATKIPYRYELARTNDKYIRNAFVYKEKIGIVSFKNLYRAAVPRLNPESSSRRFPRGPLAMEVNLSQNIFATPRKLYLLNYHLKSKVGGWKDMSELDFELNRIETAEAIRNIADDVRKNDTSKVIILLGDRNSDTGSATDDVLNGRLYLNDFKDVCKIEKRDLNSYCAGFEKHSPIFIGSIFKKLGPVGLARSYKYKNKYYLYDEIYIDNYHSYLVKDAGTYGEFGKGSDHLLTWIEIK